MIKKEVLARNMVRASFFVENKAHRRLLKIKSGRRVN